jgi:hypothetical protein
MLPHVEAIEQAAPTNGPADHFKNVAMHPVTAVDHTTHRRLRTVPPMRPHRRSASRIASGCFRTDRVFAIAPWGVSVA